jgi:ornithine decarboxylase
MTQVDHECEVKRCMANAIEPFSDVGSLLRTECPKEPVYCIFPHVVRETAEKFLRGFPGRVLYAVKANADPTVLNGFYSDRMVTITSLAEKPPAVQKGQ